MQSRHYLLLYTHIILWTRWHIINFHYLKIRVVYFRLVSRRQKQTPWLCACYPISIKYDVSISKSKAGSNSPKHAYKSHHVHSSSPLTVYYVNKVTVNIESVITRRWPFRKPKNLNHKTQNPKTKTPPSNHKHHFQNGRFRSVQIAQSPCTLWTTNRALWKDDVSV